MSDNVPVNFPMVNPDELPFKQDVLNPKRSAFRRRTSQMTRRFLTGSEVETTRQSVPIDERRSVPGLSKSHLTCSQV